MSKQIKDAEAGDCFSINDNSQICVFYKDMYDEDKLSVIWWKDFCKSAHDSEHFFNKPDAIYLGNLANILEEFGNEILSS